VPVAQAKAVGAHSLALLILSAGSSAGDTLQFIIDKFAVLLLAKLFHRSTRSSNFRQKSDKFPRFKLTLTTKAASPARFFPIGCIYFRARCPWIDREGEMLSPLARDTSHRKYK
jgi:hypothetical protein